MGDTEGHAQIMMGWMVGWLVFVSGSIILQNHNSSLRNQHWQRRQTTERSLHEPQHLLPEHELVNQDIPKQTHKGPIPRHLHNKNQTIDASLWLWLSPGHLLHWPPGELHINSTWTRVPEQLPEFGIMVNGTGGFCSDLDAAFYVSAQPEWRRWQEWRKISQQ